MTKRTGVAISLGLLLCTGCMQRALVIATTPGIEGCADSTTLYDVDGTVHVLGCGSVKTYHCTERPVSHTEQVRVTTRVHYETHHDYRLNKEVKERKGGESKLVNKTTFAMRTDCKADAPDSPPTTLRAVPSRQVAPPVERGTSDGQVKLHLDLVLNYEALLKLDAIPSARDDAIHFRLSRRQLDRNLDTCQLGVTIDGQAVAAQEVSSKRDDEMFADSFWITGSELSSLDRIKRLSLTSCNRRWFLSRDQILRTREFMGQFRQELARLAPPASPPPSQTPAAGPSATDAPAATPPAAFPDAPSVPTPPPSAPTPPPAPPSAGRR